ncbi:MAG TPA: hypothetical protein VFC53_02675 [Dehalococcoidia bacterium]|jgi:uncharacterized membrane protein|nr:hypothetical protein [Dehalococcoidia bacterium]
MGDAINLAIHIIAAAVFVGPQVFLFLAAIPAMRTIEDVQARTRATRMVTARFGWIAGIALAVLIVTGIENYRHADSLGYLHFERYFFVLQAKLTLVTIVVILTALHGGLIGRRLLQLQESDAPEAEIAAVRRWSVLLSALVLLLSLAILVCAALLGSDWSLRGGIR